MVAIHKYPLDIVSQQGIDVSGYMGCLSVKEVRKELVFYIMVDTDPTLQTRTMQVKIVGTGNNASETKDYRFVGSVAMKDSIRVWHVFIKEPE